MATALERVAERRPRAELSPIGWFAEPGLTYEEWLRHGSRLGLAGRSAAWWIGDWVRYGTARYGSKYAAASRVTGYDRQTLMNMVYVASRFEISRRRENLSWSHHAELAALDIEEQEHWLDRSIQDRLTVRDLREELASAKRPASRSTAVGAAGSNGRPNGRASKKRPGGGDLADARSGRSGAERLVLCPHCGHTFIA